MPVPAPTPTASAPSTYLTEEEFAERVDAWSLIPDHHARLTALLREDDAVYAERDGTAIIRMRGWVLLRLARLGIDDTDLPFVLEELESGIHPYLAAASARALRSYREPVADFIPFLLRCFANIYSSDEPLSFDAYGEYAIAETSETAVGELILTLDWLNPVAADYLAAIESLVEGGVPRKYRRDVSRIAKSLRQRSRSEHLRSSCCESMGPWRGLLSWGVTARRDGAALERVVFEDHSGAAAEFAELFRGRPTIVVFFYTRCDNPLKCSLTVSKLARIQTLLAAKGLTGDIQTVAITYDPQFDHPQRMARYGLDRGLKLDERNRMLRTVGGFDSVRRHFALGLNFIGSLVNRHRLEVFILDQAGNTAVQFSRLQWDEQQVVDRAIEVLHEQPAGGEAVIESECEAARCSLPPSPRRGRIDTVTRLLGVGGSLFAAFFPKCPVCWAAYLSMFGVAGLGKITSSPWLWPILVAAILVNLASVGWRGFKTGRMIPFYLVASGVCAILVVRLGLESTFVAAGGVVLTLAGTFWTALNPYLRRPLASAADYSRNAYPPRQR